LFHYEPPKPIRKSTSIKQKPPPRKSQEVIEHLKKGWLPIDPDVFEEVRLGISRGFSIDALIELIKQDAGLFFHCARGLRQQLTTKSDEGIDPIEELRKLEIEKLGALLDIDSALLPSRNPYEESPIIASCDQISQISAKVAETLAKDIDIAPSIAFSSALFRKLGHYLIAWNYPKLYSRTLAQHRRTAADIDTQLEKLLGISPNKIGAQFAQDWGMQRSIHRPLQGNSALLQLKPEHQELSAEHISVAELCELSEIFAKAKQPNSYPGATELWASKELLVRTVWGEDIFGHIEEAAQTVLSRKKLEDSPETESDEKVRDRALKANKYLHNCPEYIVESFTKVYQALDETQVSLNAIRVLADYVVPELGFARGCVYLKDEKTFELKAAMRIGNVPLKAYDHLLLDSRKGLVSALQTSAPVSIESSFVNGESGTIVFGNLRNKRYHGVLYLEISDEAHSQDYFDALTLFHTVRETFNSCLGG